MTSLTPAELAEMKEHFTKHGYAEADDLVPRLIAALEAAWAENDRLRRMVAYARQAPNLDGAVSVLTDALDGVDFARNLDEIRGERERLRAENERLRTALGAARRERWLARTENERLRRDNKKFLQALTDTYTLLSHYGVVPDEDYHLVCNAAALLSEASPDA